MYVTTRLGRLFYEEAGASASADAPAIVLWHSFLCDGGMWDGQVAALGGLGRVIVFDGHGHGKSDAPPAHTLEEGADALLEALTALKVKRAALVGLSWGGMLAMRIALREPERVAALALLDTSASPELIAKQLKYRLMLSTFRRLGLPRRIVDRQVVPLMFAHATRAARPDVIARWTTDLEGFSREGVYQTGRAIFWREDIVPKIGQIKAKTLVLCGAEDVALPPDRSRIIAERIEGSKLVLVPNAGHLSTMDAPSAVTAELVAFLRDAL
ncbi:alpha/beta fold hydrolase [soil metagenome]